MIAVIDIRKTIAKILAWISGQYIVLSNETSFSVNAGANKPGSLSDWGINIPSGYQAIAISPVLAGSYSTTDSYWCIYGVGGMFNEYGVLVKNTGAQQRNWKLKLVVLCEKVGGVLRSSFFKAFSRFASLQKGGGVDETTNKRTPCEDTKRTNRCDCSGNTASSRILFQSKIQNLFGRCIKEWLYAIRTCWVEYSDSRLAFQPILYKWRYGTPYYLQSVFHSLGKRNHDAIRFIQKEYLTISERGWLYA